MLFDWAFAFEILPTLAKAALITIQATLAAYVLALVLGLILALFRRSRWRSVRWPVAFFIEFVRSTPVLIQIYFIYWVLPRYGINLSAMVSGLLALGLHYATYTSEVYRAGLDNVPKGQWDAAIALNFSSYRIYREIVIPQAIPPIVPAMGNYLIAMFKETAILSAIAVVELLQTAKIIGSQTFRYIEPITLVGVFFLVMSLVSAAAIRRTEVQLSLEHRLGRPQLLPAGRIPSNREMVRVK
jgi:polar amino acid transport system permease protein